MARSRRPRRHHRSTRRTRESRSPAPARGPAAMAARATEATDSSRTSTGGRPNASARDSGNARKSRQAGPQRHRRQPQRQRTGSGQARTGNSGSGCLHRRTAEPAGPDRQRRQRPGRDSPRVFSLGGGVQRPVAGVAGGRSPLCAGEAGGARTAGVGGIAEQGVPPPTRRTGANPSYTGNKESDCGRCRVCGFVQGAHWGFTSMCGMAARRAARGPGQWHH